MVQSARTLSAVTVCAAMFAMVASGVGAAEKKYGREPHERGGVHVRKGGATERVR